ncbi:peptidase domain-containing ABC transporter [Hymenobacter baengnokdamensis]|uniref:peptidase domain-containing ABC transporter n=1 Tax=Hymenobacter baengnokdamensis TaxID=2615203 RepID=UPI001244F203|nr:peptidase domain-containing ABC transporter [Hymenobacter baengnokdamensis]
MLFQKPFPFVQQQNSMDCGVACLAMIARHYGQYYTVADLLGHCTLTKNGLLAQDVSRLAEKLGFRTLLAKVPFESLARQVPLPCIVHWNREHYVVAYRIDRQTVYYADPASGLRTCTRQEFLRQWRGDQPEGFALLIETTPAFYATPLQTTQLNKAQLSFVGKYITQYRLYFSLLAVSLLFGCLLQLALPFVTQWIVDYGIAYRDVDFIYLAAAALLLIYVSSTAVDFIRSRLLIHLSTRVNIFIISDFLIKLMSLPISFFDSRFKGDLLQRIRDHDRIERFLTDTLLRSFFSVFTALILAGALWYYSARIFGVFLGCTALEIGWIFMHLKQMRTNDNELFTLASREQSKLYEMINSIQDIKLNNIEKKIRWEWEKIQALLFRQNIIKLNLSQKQNGGARFFSYLLIVLVNLIGAVQVVHQTLSFGSLIAITFIIGQLNAPISQLLSLILQGYSARFSLERLGEIYGREDESSAVAPADRSGITLGDIRLENVSFHFPGSEQQVLQNLSLTIPVGKVTAIVGQSGSGKTSLIKLLLKFYTADSGSIRVGRREFTSINAINWRDKCGSVLQDSFIFADSIAANICLDEYLDEARLVKAARMANIHVFIDSLPRKYQTVIGENGLGISQGQRQRILIARTIYKNPEVIFFDEATNALDANNEKEIMANLAPFLAGRTVIVSAHRLSTVKYADQIILLHDGRIVEIGTHEQLLANRKGYYQLVENQITLS